MKKILFIGLLIVLAGFQQKPVKTILFLGDSLTAGYGLSPDQAFPAVAESLLKQKGKNVKVINAGISGETSAGGLARIDWVLKQPVDILFLELGANDGLRGLPVSETEKNLQGIIDKVKAKNKSVKVVLAGMMVPPNMGKEYSSQFEKVFINLASRNKCVRIPFLLDGVGGIERLNQADGIHPTAEGHRIVANTVVKTLEPLL
ncbi:MAG: arylesterase [Cyclobacteriaceae bacterium]